MRPDITRINTGPNNTVQVTLQEFADSNKLQSKQSGSGAKTPVSVLGSILGSSLAESDPRDNTKGKTPVSTDPSKVRPS